MYIKFISAVVVKKNENKMYMLELSMNNKKNSVDLKRRAVEN